MNDHSQSRKEFLSSTMDAFVRSNQSLLDFLDQGKGVAGTPTVRMTACVPIHPAGGIDALEYIHTSNGTEDLLASTGPTLRCRFAYADFEAILRVIDQEGLEAFSLSNDGNYLEYELDSNPTAKDIHDVIGQLVTIVEQAAQRDRAAQDCPSAAPAPGF